MYLENMMLSGGKKQVAAWYVQSDTIYVTLKHIHWTLLHILVFDACAVYDSGGGVWGLGEWGGGAETENEGDKWGFNSICNLK